MTRKHFERIAQALRTSRPPDEDGMSMARAKWIDLCGDIAEICAADNPSFNRSTFLTACGV